MRGNLEDQKNKEPAYISKGFSAWKKVPKCFYSHQDSASHQASSTYHLIVPQCIYVGEMTDDQTIQQRQIERKYLRCYYKMLSSALDIFLVKEFHCKVLAIMIT